MNAIIILSLLLSGEYITATCTQGLRGDPVLVVRGLDRDNKPNAAYLYFLPDQHQECQFAAKRWNNYKTDSICACKQLKTPGIDDRVLLRCVARKAAHLYSRRIMIFYYSNLKQQCLDKARKLEEQWRK